MSSSSGSGGSCQGWWWSRESSDLERVACVVSKESRRGGSSGDGGVESDTCQDIMCQYDVWCCKQGVQWQTVGKLQLTISTNSDSQRGHWRPPRSRGQTLEHSWHLTYSPFTRVVLMVLTMIYCRKTISQLPSKEVESSRRDQKR
jgi:hypothetical protein